MIRLAIWIIASLAVTAGVAWLISLPGTLTLEFMDLRMQPRLGIAAFIVILAVFAIILVWGLLRRLIAAPYYLARRTRDRRKEQGFVALSDGFIALQAGDAARARMLAREARSNMPSNAAAQLLEARSCGWRSAPGSARCASRWSWLRCRGCSCGWARRSRW